MLRPYISGCLLPTSRNAGSVVATRRHRDRGCPGGGRSAGRRVARVRLPARGALAPARHPHPYRSRAAVGRDRPRHGGSEACRCVARGGGRQPGGAPAARRVDRAIGVRRLRRGRRRAGACRDRKSTRLNSSHGYISYAVFCLKKKKKNNISKSNRKNPVTAITQTKS